MLFRLERNPACERENSILGFAWIEVLAITPRALANAGEGEEWCWKVLESWYICRTELGLQRISETDLWTAVEVADEYRLASQDSRKVSLSPHSPKRRR